MSADRTTKMKRSGRNALSAALIMIGAAAMYNWVLSPHVGYLRAVQRYQHVMDEMVEERERIGGTIEQRRRQLRSMQRELAETDESLFTREEAKAFASDLQLVVTRTGCAMVTAEFMCQAQAERSQESAKRNPVTTTHVSLAVLGQYDQLVSLLERLQASRRKIWVDSCQMEIFDLRSGQLKCNLDLTTHALCDEEGFVDE